MTAPPEIAALLLTNRRLTTIVVALAMFSMLLVATVGYLVYIKRAVVYTTISGGISLAMPGELDETVVSDFAESVIARLGNVGPESIDGVSTWVMRRAHPKMRVTFDAWLDAEKSRIQADDLRFTVEDPTTITIEKLSTFGEPRYGVTVRARQTITVVSESLDPRLIDIQLEIGVGKIDKSYDLVIRHIDIPGLLTVEGTVVNVLREG